MNSSVSESPNSRPHTLPPTTSFEPSYKRASSQHYDPYYHDEHHEKRNNELLSFMSTGAAQNNEVVGDDGYDYYDVAEVEANKVADNSDSSSEEDYEWVYYDVEECKSCSSSEENGGQNGIDDDGFDDDSDFYEYYDEITASDDDYHQDANEYVV